MIEFPHRSENFVFAVDPATATTLDIAVAGPGLRLFSCLAGTPHGDDDAAIPDPVLLLESAVGLGLFPGAIAQAPQIFDVGEHGIANNGTSYHWQVAVGNLTPGVFRVLANLLVARGMTDIRIVAVPKPEPASIFGPHEIPYPAIVGQPDFDVDYAPNDKRSRERSIEAEMLHVPSDETLQQLYEMCDVWSRLVMLGGYARNDQPGTSCGAFADVACLVGPKDLRQSFDMFFDADEAAFDPFITYFTSGKGRSVALRRIAIG